MTAKRTHLAVRLLPAEREKIAAAAAGRGLSLSKYVLEAALLAALDPGEDSTADQIDTLRRLHVRPGMSAGEFAALLPEHLRSAYWHSKIGQLVREQGLDSDDPPPPSSPSERAQS